MSSWLKRLFGLPHGTAEQSAAQPEPAISMPSEQEADDFSPTIWQPQADVNTLFYQWLMSGDAPAETVSKDTETELLDALDRLSKSELAGANLMPRVPAVIPHLLKSLRDENVSALQLSSEIAHDVVLVAEVIRQANSSYYRQAEPIAGLENAVMVLGQNGLRMVIARVAFRPIVNMQSGRFTRVAAPHIWAQSEKCAIACRSLAQEQGMDPFEALLAGLMQNVGLIVAFRLVDQVYRGTSLPNSADFCTAFAACARTLSCRIARQWDFPGNVINAIEEQGLAPGADKSALGDLLFVADQLGKMRILVNHERLQEDEALSAFGLLDGAIRCFHELNDSELM